MGKSQKIELRLHSPRKSFINSQSRVGMRPKTTSTVIRSRTSEPRIRQKL